LIIQKLKQAKHKQFKKKKKNCKKSPNFLSAVERGVVSTPEGKNTWV